MTLPVYRLRRVLAVVTVLFSAVVIGMYVYARLRTHSVLKDFPGKISYNLKQTASGFQFSKSEAGRTVFTIRAKDVKEFKLNGRADLHEVSITLYGRDSSRFDQIYGDDFSYDPKSGEVRAKGEVQIDLEANPSGLSGVDQAVPEEVKSSVHLKTRDLIFNRDTGDAATEARVDFRTAQAEGWAVGLRYEAKSEALVMGSDVHFTMSGANSGTLVAAHAVITREPREIALERPRMARGGGTLEAERAVFFLGEDSEVQRVEAWGGVKAESTSKNRVRGGKDETLLAQADHTELLLTGQENLLRTATLSGNVHAERRGEQAMSGDAGRVVLDFMGENEIAKARASEGVRLRRRGSSAEESASQLKTVATSGLQDFEMASAGMDFFVADGKGIERAETLGPGTITITPVAGGGGKAGQSRDATSRAKTTLVKSTITAGRFEAQFAGVNSAANKDKSGSRLASVHGAPEARIVSEAAGVPPRVSISDAVDAAFLPAGGIGSIVQSGHFFYDDGLPLEKRTQAWAAKAVYTPGDQMIMLTGEPRVSDGAMFTTAKMVRLNRATGDAFADGDVKSTYNDLKSQPGGGMLASGSPIHVTAAKLTAHNSPAVALYEGGARLWQDANVVEAPSIQFDRDRRELTAEGLGGKLVTTVVAQAEALAKSGGESTPREGETLAQMGDKGAAKIKLKRRPENEPVTITSSRLTYNDGERKAHYEGPVTAHTSAFTARADTMDVYFSGNGQTALNQAVSPAGRLDQMIAEGAVTIQAPGRRAECRRMVYTATEDKFVLTGGPPSIFDAEHGKVTGNSLTFYRADDRVLTEGAPSTPVVTQTRVER